MKNLLPAFLLTTSLCARAQQFTCDQLSPRYSYTITKHIATDGEGLKRIDTLKVEIYDRLQKRVADKIYPLTESSYLFLHCFDDCKTVRSYLTGKNAKAAILDFDYGDLVVADFNFDGYEDFAIKNDSGGNTGPYYRFYCSDENGSFKEDTYLSEEIAYLPDLISKKKQLKIVRPASSRMAVERIFQRKAGSWKLVSRRDLK